VVLSRKGGRPTPGKTVRFVVIAMTAEHMQVRAAKFRPLVEEAASRFNVSRNLIYAIIRVESDFNPYAINAVPAVGLMQVVPQTAGADVQAHLTGRAGEPTKAFLFEPQHNITYGTAYLSLCQAISGRGSMTACRAKYSAMASYHSAAPGALLNPTLTRQGAGPCRPSTAARRWPCSGPSCSATRRKRDYVRRCWRQKEFVDAGPTLPTPIALGTAHFPPAHVFPSVPAATGFGRSSAAQCHGWRAGRTGLRDRRGSRRRRRRGVHKPAGHGAVAGPRRPGPGSLGQAARG
jgi:hypothetical protein